jgi:signal peptidase I
VAYRKSTAREYFESICVAVILALFVRTFIVQAFKIPTGSMENNLLIGDHLLVNKFVFAPTLRRVENSLLPIDPIRRGDIIVFKYPEEPERDFIKRVIGLPGETLELKKKRVYINGMQLDEPYVHYLVPPDEESGAGDFDVRVQYGPVTVPAGHYFMMGDNRDNSQDSRYWGFMPQEYIKGKALFVYFSFGEESGLSGLVTGIRLNIIFHQIHLSRRSTGCDQDHFHHGDCRDHPERGVPLRDGGMAPLPGQGPGAAADIVRSQYDAGRSGVPDRSDRRGIRGPDRAAGHRGHAPGSAHDCRGVLHDARGTVSPYLLSHRPVVHGRSVCRFSREVARELTPARDARRPPHQT